MRNVSSFSADLQNNNRFKVVVGSDPKPLLGPTEDPSIATKSPGSEVGTIPQSSAVTSRAISMHKVHEETSSIPNEVVKVK